MTIVQFFVLLASIHFSQSYDKTQNKKAGLVFTAFASLFFILELILAK